MLAAKLCKAYKFVRFFHGPYHIVERNETGVAVWPVYQPQVESIRVGYNQIPCCADSVPELFWPVRPKVSRAASKRWAETPIGEDTVDCYFWSSIIYL